MMPRYMSVSIIIFIYYLIVLRYESIFVLYFEIKQLTILTIGVNNGIPFTSVS